MKVLAFGEILWDVINGEKYLGGAPLNFAFHYAQCGGEAAMLSRVGDDPDGKSALEAVNQLGVTTEMVTVDRQFPTGLVHVQLSNGQPSYEIERPAAYDHIPQPSKDLSGTSDALYFGTLAQRASTSRETLRFLREQGGFSHVFYDVNLRKDSYSQEVIQDSLNSCTILKLNDEEVEVIAQLIFGISLSFQSFVDKVFGEYDQMTMVVLTKGAEGCTIYQRTGSQDVGSEKVVVKDTVGAGDSFSAAFLYFFQAGVAPEKAARLANKIAGFVASSHGPTPLYSEEIKKHIKDAMRNL